MTNTPFPNDSNAAVPSDRLWLRSELMGTQVITRDTGRRLGVVGEVVVDIDRREVIALGLRDNPLTRFLPGLPKWMLLEQIRQVGDVILVDSIESVTEDFAPERFSKVINCQVITESGQQLGRVLGYSFDIETGELISLVMGALGVPLLGEGVLSTWEIPVNEIVSSGADRIIVYEGAEEKLNQLSSGLLEKLGVGGSNWDERERERYRVNFVPVENQLSSGEEIDEAQKVLTASKQEVFNEEEQELEYVELNSRDEEQNSRYLEEPNDLTYSQYSESESLTNNLGFDQTTYSNSQFQSSKRSLDQQDLTNPKRAIQDSDGLLDVEPLELDVNNNIKPEISEQTLKSKIDFDEIEDPW